MNSQRNNYFVNNNNEWVNIQKDIAICGINDHAQSLLGELVFIDFPEVNTLVSIGEEVCTIESVKSVSDICAPVSGRIIEVNNNLIKNPMLINNSCYYEGWCFKIEMSDRNELNSLNRLELLEK